MCHLLMLFTYEPKSMFRPMKVTKNTIFQKVKKIDILKNQKTEQITPKMMNWKIENIRHNEKRKSHSLISRRREMAQKL